MIGLLQPGQQCNIELINDVLLEEVAAAFDDLVRLALGARYLRNEGLVALC